MVGFCHHHTNQVSDRFLCANSIWHRAVAQAHQWRPTIRLRWVLKCLPVRHIRSIVQQMFNEVLQLHAACHMQARHAVVIPNGADSVRNLLRQMHQMVGLGKISHLHALHHLQGNACLTIRTKECSASEPHRRYHRPIHTADRSPRRPGNGAPTQHRLP